MRGISAVGGGWKWDGSVSKKERGERREERAESRKQKAERRNGPRTTGLQDDKTAGENGGNLTADGTGLRDDGTTTDEHRWTGILNRRKQSGYGRETASG